VKLIHARACLARDRAALTSAAPEFDGHRVRPALVGAGPHQYTVDPLLTTGLDSIALAALYRDRLHQLRILERYPVPDSSIADQWVGRELLATGTDPVLVAAVLRHGSPGFPRRHADSEVYLCRAPVSMLLAEKLPGSAARYPDNTHGQPLRPGGEYRGAGLSYLDRGGGDR
jgi:hypothetical protein